VTRLRLRARDRRALLLGLIVVTPFTGYRIAIEPWLTYRSGLQDALLAERDLLARERGLIQDADSGPISSADLESTLAQARPWLLAGTSRVAATGQLTRIATQAAQSVGVLVQEVQAGDPVSQVPGIEMMSISVRALGDLEGLTRFLFAMENSEPLLHVREVSLRTAGMNDGDLERGQLMSAGFVLVGYWEPPVETEEPRASAGQ